MNACINNVFVKILKKKSLLILICTSKHRYHHHQQRCGYPKKILFTNNKNRLERACVEEQDKTKPKIGHFH